MNADCLMKHTSTKQCKYGVKQKLENFDIFIFREHFGTTRVCLCDLFACFYFFVCFCFVFYIFFFFFFFVAFCCRFSHGSCIMQSVQITTNVESSNSAHGEVYSMQNCVLWFVVVLQLVGGFLWIFQFASTIELNVTI